MTALLGIAAGLVLTGTLMIGGMILAAFELGRAFSRDDEQREVAPVHRLGAAERPRRGA